MKHWHDVEKHQLISEQLTAILSGRENDSNTIIFVNNFHDLSQKLEYNACGFSFCGLKSITIIRVMLIFV